MSRAIGTKLNDRESALKILGALPDGTLLALWRRPLQIGQPLAVIPLALSTSEAIAIDLEQTYHQAAKRAYLE